MYLDSKSLRHDIGAACSLFLPLTPSHTRLHVWQQQTYVAHTPAQHCLALGRRELNMCQITSFSEACVLL